MYKKDVYDPDAFHAALADWKEALNTSCVRHDEEILKKYARSSSNNELAPRAILFPASTTQVQEIVRIANSYLIPLHAISRGKNWGYGDACAPMGGQVIVDLSQMNKILEVDVEQGYARIEAGVSQGELFEYIRSRNLPLWMDATAAGPDASIVGNTLDRGFGHTRYGDRSSTSCGMTVVLPDGSLLKTGFSHYKNAQAHRSYRNGVGPFMDGLFFQSNLGIVTEIGLWLMPKPEYYSAFFFSADSEDALAQIIDRLAPLKRQMLLPSAVHIGNDLRLLSSSTRYPWHKTGGHTPLPKGVRSELRHEFGVGAWVGCGALYGTYETVKANEKRLKKELRGLRPIFINDKKLRFLSGINKILDFFGAGKSLRKKLESVKPIYELLQGIPGSHSIQGAQWRVRGEAIASEGSDLLDSNAGLIWISPVLPMTGAAATEVYRIMEEIFSRFGFDTLVTFTMITDRALCAVSNVAYDRRNEEEVVKAKQCYKELFSVLMDKGYVPYRTGPGGFSMLTKNSSGFWDFATLLKQAIDPKAILSPGRYIPASQNGSDEF